MNATVSPAVRLKIQGMDCGSCALTIEQAVRAVPGIATVRVDFTTETLEATGSATSALIEERETVRLSDGASRVLEFHPDFKFVVIFASHTTSVFRRGRACPCPI